ncbi:phage baseplate plug protein [Asaia sp. HumB]|uniref:phage baseplate plug family protein n=1 Tax=Asaia sp. HumB TaxID=3035475 RepID=UPI002555A97A|nr:hypothetical protein [Asaia sp. HumB]MDL2169829.1 hypothetical protein [Asaia sp. HumB]
MAGIIPLAATPSQTLNVVLSGQNIRLDVQQRRTGIYLNVWQNETQVVSGTLALTGTYIVRAAYLGLPGDFAFIDLQGSDDPDYSGFGTRWFLFYSGA